jgi:hypothetical protein
MTQEQMEELVARVTRNVVEELQELEEEEECYCTEEEEETVPEYFITVNGTLITEGIYSADELRETLESIEASTDEVEVSVYKLLMTVSTEGGN